MNTCNVNIKQYLGNNIKDICSNSYHKNSDNHCAHFVSHVLGIKIGFKCRSMTGKGDLSSSSSIRVHEIFAKCPQVGEWSNKPANMTFCLAFVTSASNVNIKTRVMENHPKKHIGIFHNGKVYHYSNGQDKVVEQSPGAFAKHYSGSDVTVYFGTMPL